MTASQPRQALSWSARLAWSLLLLVAGAALAVWGLSRWEQGARFFGVVPPQPAPLVRQVPVAVPVQPGVQPLAAADAARIAALEIRLAAIESQAQAAAGSAGRADALLIAFAARRAIDRGVALGYLEPLLLERFGGTHRAAVSTIVTASRDPVRLDRLAADYAALGPLLRGGGPEEGWWDRFRRELGSIVSIHRADTPSPQPQARFDRAQARLESGEVDQALAETMRMPGADNAGPWVARARRYISAHRALDELESAALLGDTAAPAQSLPAQ